MELYLETTENELFKLMMKEHQYSEYIVNITILFITGSEKKTGF